MGVRPALVVSPYLWVAYGRTVVGRITSPCCLSVYRLAHSRHTGLHGHAIQLDAMNGHSGRVCGLMHELSLLELYVVAVKTYSSSSRTMVSGSHEGAPHFSQESPSAVSKSSH